MSDFYSKLIDCRKSDWLQEEYPNAFLLLSYIARHCRKTNLVPDGLEIGDCMVGEIETPKKCGLSSKEYRNAMQKLIEFGLIEIVYNPQSRKLKKGNNFLEPQKRAIKRASQCKIVNICSTEVYDIRFNDKGDQKGESGASQGRAKGDKQRMLEHVEHETTTTPTPSSGKVVDVVFLNPKNNQLQHSKKLNDLEDENCNITYIISPQNISTHIPKEEFFPCLSELKCDSITNKDRFNITQKYINQENLVEDAVKAVLHPNFKPQTTILKSIWSACKGAWKPPISNKESSFEYTKKNKEFAKILEMIFIKEPGVFNCLNSNFEIVLSPRHVFYISYDQPFQSFYFEIESKSGKKINKIPEILNFLKKEECG